MTRAVLRGCVLAAFLVAMTIACGENDPEPPPVLAVVGEFDLLERSGARLTREDLLGRPWVASFLFTRCTGPCPRVRSTLKKLETRLEDTNAILVTFSVDPAFDTPEVLAEYAKSVQADPRRWLFVTGEQAAIYDLAQNSFKSAAQQAPPGTAPIGEQVAHSTRLVAVDKRGRVRGFFHGEADDQIDLLVAQLELLQDEKE